MSSGQKSMTTERAAATGHTRLASAGHFFALVPPRSAQIVGRTSTLSSAVLFLQHGRANDGNGPPRDLSVRSGAPCTILGSGGAMHHPDPGVVRSQGRHGWEGVEARAALVTSPGGSQGETGPILRAEVGQMGLQSKVDGVFVGSGAVLLAGGALGQQAVANDFQGPSGRTCTRPTEASRSATGDW